MHHLARIAARGGMSRRDFLGAAAAAGLSLSTATGLLTTGAKAQEETPRRGGHLRLGIQGGGSTDVLDPGLYLANVMLITGRNFGDTLVETHPETGLPLPGLAESWEASEDARVWRLRIRRGVQFHDGKELTVEDCVATLQRHSDAESNSAALGIMEGVESVEADGDELVVTLTTGDADLPLLLSDYHLIIQPNGGRDDPNAGIGTGPYRIESFEPGVRIMFTRNENDWRDDRGFVDSVELLVINDATARTAALSSGQVHFVNRVEPRTVDLLARAPNIEILQTSGRGHYLFPAHTNTAPFDNNDLRLALKYAIDREAMLETVLRGFGSVGNDFPINQNYALAPDDIEQRPFDPDRAAFHLRESGHEGPILLRTSDVAFPGAVDAAQLYQQTCAQAGIQIEIRREPGDGYWSNVWNVQPFCASYWGGRATQDQFYSTGYYSRADWNDTRFSNERFDSLLLEARPELDEGRRRELYREMALIVRDEGGAIIPMFNDFVNAARAEVKGFVHDIGNDTSNGYVATRVWLDA
nr:ABC transporter substrate-binding protein [Aureimonas populi]